MAASIHAWRCLWPIDCIGNIMRTRELTAAVAAPPALVHNANAALIKHTCSVKTCAWVGCTFNEASEVHSCSCMHLGCLPSWMSSATYAENVLCELVLQKWGAVPLE
jgi:hypothetical protein